jgi:hypothetical protein
MIGCDPEFFLRHLFGTLLHDEDAIGPAAWNEYLRCFRNPETIRATCDEYRAGASIDLVHDRADLAQNARVPILVLWGMRSGQGMHPFQPHHSRYVAAAVIADTQSQRSSHTSSMRQPLNTLLTSSSAFHPTMPILAAQVSRPIAGRDE